MVARVALLGMLHQTNALAGETVRRDWAEGLLRGIFSFTMLSGIVSTGLVLSNTKASEIREAINEILD